MKPYIRMLPVTGMKTSLTTPNRLLLPAAFVVSLTGMWALRWGFFSGEPAGPVPAGLPRTRGIPFHPGGNPEAGPDLLKPEGLYSVKSGWVVWPENGDAAAVTEAFKAA